MGDVFLSHRDRRRRRPVIVAAAVVGLLALVVAALGSLWFVERGRLPARTTIAGVAVGGLAPQTARATVARETARRIAASIVLVGPRGTASTTGRELGARAILTPAFAAADDVGPFFRVVRLVGFGAIRVLPVTYRLDPDRVEALADRLDERFGDPAIEAAVTTHGLAVTVTPAAVGTGVDRVEIAQRLAALPRRLTLALGRVQPLVSTAAAMVAGDRVKQLVSEPRSVRHEDVDATLWPRRLAALIVTVPTAGGALDVTLDPEGLVEALRPKLGRFETPPQDASFERDGDGWRLVPEAAGFVLDGERIGASLAKHPASTVHRARFTTAEPQFTVALAEKLGIKELVSEFTTLHKCCAPRVSNIHRGAGIVDGTVVLPGEEFSLNQVMGERTAARGFVLAPQILAGRLTDAIGGGVSQIATTIYNAAFFAGVELVAHQPHQFYISRYPMGREATVSWGGPELVWKNDWPAAVLVDVSTTDTSITVRFFSSLLGREVRTETGQPSGYVQPRRIVVRNKELKQGEKHVIQEAGPAGFSISYTRTVLRDGEVVREERFSWRYDPEHKIVEFGPKRQGTKRPPALPAADAAGSDGSTG